MKTTVEPGDLGLLLYADRFGGVVLCEEGLRLTRASVAVREGDFVRVVGCRVVVAQGLENSRRGEADARKSFALAESLLRERSRIQRRCYCEEWKGRGRI